jgi:hypothetical protein
MQSICNAIKVKIMRIGLGNIILVPLFLVEPAKNVLRHTLNATRLGLPQ